MINFFPLRLATLLAAFTIFQCAASIEITCNYYGYDWNNWGAQYTCSAKLVKVTDEHFTATSAVGDHRENHSNYDVKGVEIHGQRMYYLLKGLVNLFPNLDQLYVFRSDLTHLSRSDFKNYTQLKTISLSRDHLSKLPYDTFEDLIDLEYFSLSFNQLKSIPNMKTLKNLKELYLFENSIESLSKDDLSHNENLRIIWLYHNKLTYIDPDIFDYLPALTSADLTNNLCIDKKYTRYNAAEVRDYIKEHCNVKPDESIDLRVIA